MSVIVEMNNSIVLQDMNRTETFINDTYKQNYSNISTTPLTYDEVSENSLAHITVLCIKSFVFGSIIMGAVLGNALGRLNLSNTMTQALKPMKSFGFSPTAFPLAVLIGLHFRMKFHNCSMQMLKFFHNY